MANIDVNKTLQDLAEYTRMEQELTAQIDALKDEIKQYMTANELTELLGQHGEKVYWKPVVSKRFDTTAFKKSEWAELYEEFCRPSETRPFKFFG